MRLPLLRRQVQNPHVLPVCTPRLLRHQCVIGPPVRHGRVQVLSVHITRERPRLPYQPVDHVPIVDAVLPLATQSFHRLHQRSRVPHLDLLRTKPRFQPLPPQPRRHRVRILLHLDRAPLAHPHPLTLQRLQPTLRQRTQPRLLLRKLLGPRRIPPGQQHTRKLPVVLGTDEVAAATQQQFLVQRFLETPMPLLAIAVLMAAVGVRGLGRHPVVTHQGLIAGRVLFEVAVVMHGQRHAIRAVSRGRRAQFP
jgi:hypothetical protein